MDEVKKYLDRLEDEGSREWQLTRGRLHGCKYANPIFDFHADRIWYLGEKVWLPVSVQLFLDDARDLDEYLVMTRQRSEKYRSRKGVPHDNWPGISNPAKWIELARAIAEGLADIHRRRVVHGDIWPPNIFIQVIKGKPLPIFIDFGEAFPIEPKGHPKNQRDHAYRAPERRDAQSIVTQRADVYSFGKLLLYLATGREPIIPPTDRGHNRRELVRQQFTQRNEGLLNENPYIVDIICKCVALDPVDRPSMEDVLTALNTYVDISPEGFNALTVPSRVESLRKTWEKINVDLAGRAAHVAPVLERLIEQQLGVVESMMVGLSNEVINLTETRERLIVAMVGLFDALGEGDRYLSLTSPRMWQGSALGLDGRFFNATQLAATRGASIQRAFIFSIQEVGEEWATQLSLKLDQLAAEQSHDAAKCLASMLRIETNSYRAALQKGSVRALEPELQLEAQQRLKLVIKSYLRAHQTMCRDSFDQGTEFRYSENCKGIFVGLLPVHSLSEMQTLKSAHPVSVFIYSRAEVRDRYLLMMTDCVGRNSYTGATNAEFDDTVFQRSKPELRGITVFKSVLGIPEDRIKKLEEQFRQSIPVGPWIDQLYSAFPS